MIGPPFYLRPIPCELAESCRRQCLIAAGSAEAPCPTSAPSCPGCSSGGWCSPSAFCSVPDWCGRSGPRSRSSSPSPSPSPCSSRATARGGCSSGIGERGTASSWCRRWWTSASLRRSSTSRASRSRPFRRSMCWPSRPTPSSCRPPGARSPRSSLRRSFWATRSGPGPAPRTRRSGRRSWCSTWCSRSSRSWATASARRAWSRRRSPSSSSGCGSRRTTSCGTSGPGC